MSRKLTAKTSIPVKASIDNVWKALTDPAIIKQYLFGTDTKAEWKKGGSITYTGEWEGKSYEDKGTVVEIIPGKLLHTTFYSPMSGLPDLPENYANVIYEITPEKEVTLLTISQDNLSDEESRQRAVSNWDRVLQSFRETVEKL
ncbi:SRPBCC family protein [Chitinophaga cymbidii]|uniref:Activator of Hsp90 ATPase homologue 1/2-like C-terminal domain-containing protein n=1 Tax=Chitinophaga cymbidii TaxID=1096750 RepID=A0A512RNT1_9BACT|nr:SRPBCC family protein [Chitinophaga cymbidii]GEP97355.1 hypothetical protein CCY01nite_36150 [Chitinophaga cymbidii]